MKAHLTPLLPVFHSLRTIILATAMLAGISHSEEARNWNLKEINGKEYVNVDSIREFYRLDRTRREGTTITAENRTVALKLEIESPWVTLNKLRVHLGNPVVEMDGDAYLSRTDLGAMVDPILRPNTIPNAEDFQMVILDPAHGSKNPGTMNEFGTEATHTMKIAGRTKEELEKKGFRVVMTRDGENDPTEKQRRDLANAVEESAVFIQISFGSGPEESPGIETRTICPLVGETVKHGDGTSAYGSASVALATSTHGSIIRKLGKNTKDGGLSRGEISVLSEIRHPSISVVLGSMTNPDDAQLISNDRYQDAIARAICEGVSRYRYAVSENQPANASEEAPAEPE